MLAHDDRIDASRFRAAAKRFKAFFRELRTYFVEREQILDQVALALLAKEHVLLTGPPGTAKSRVASAVLGRIYCAETGAPSLYARQITESTVQTDLIGPVDFKNLMETGRTEHFTDEGILGAHHAFLDEVFDGRDMLLRSALNVLQERELKQGSSIKKGRIECALLTSNRYISEVLETNRQTLLAFVDRIAFIGFVPRGFARRTNLDRVLKRQLASADTSPLDALLTLQDVDVLQAVTERVHVSRGACAALGRVLTKLDEELAAATRADPTFVPTRYLSTRTAVRAGQILRAAVALDAIENDPDRVLQVQRKDFERLGLHLVLAGPSDSEITDLLMGAVEPVERHQLEILRTEREALGRALDAAGDIPTERVASPLAEAPAAPVSEAPNSPAPAASPDVISDEATSAEETRRTIQEGDVATVLSTLRSILETGPDALEPTSHAEQLAELAMGRLYNLTIRQVIGHAEQAPPSESSSDDARAAAILAPLRGLIELSEDMGDTSQSLHKLVQWLRRHAIERLDEIAQYLSDQSTLRTVFTTSDISHIEQAAERRLTLFEELAVLRHRLVRLDAESPAAIPRATAATAAHGESSDWQRALLDVETELAALWERAFCLLVEQRLEQSGTALADVLSATQPFIERMRASAARIEALVGTPRFHRKVLGERLAELVRGLLRKPQDRHGLDAQVSQVLELLGDVNLADAIDAQQWLEWTIAGLVEVEEAAAASPPPEAERDYDLDGYRTLRDDGERVPLSYVMATMALRVDPALQEHAEDVSEPLVRVLGAVPETVRERVATLDLGRVDRAVTFLEGWWQAYRDTGTNEPSPPARPALRDADIVKVFWQENALARFALEAQLLGDLLPHRRPETDALRQRLRTLDAALREAMILELRGDTEARFQRALGH